ncbi:hypothetical protein BB560_000778 [Smittium megazygosporum]|uniref:HpcH/HpaI aldolase/citrate lyase domain-containing protein n=1 Tax=Smittium megazygosporum TaxID=133381 RepID=A0A2T9ZJI2_9FUNG|nr:hypothetical protein BB560_000778 [Smittium megazygosporum]
MNAFRLTTKIRVAPQLLQSKALLSRAYTIAPMLKSDKKIRRSLMYVPCSEERKIQKSLKSQADCIMYDLEDGVSLNRKGQARQMVTSALELQRDKASELGVRINAIGSGLELDDLQVILQSKKLETILVPKVQTPTDIAFVSNMIDTLAPEETKHKIKIIAAIESALGIMNIREIATCNPRIDSLLFAAEDYCNDTEMTRTPSKIELYYARATVSNAAHAYGLEAIDMVCMDFKSKETLKDECLNGLRLGFSGKQAIHPDQIDMINASFCPSPDVIDRAVKIVKGFEEHSSKGIGAFDLDGKAIDMPVVKWAEKIIIRAKLSGVDVEKLLA